MSILLDHQLREQIPHTATAFPVSYYHDELETLPRWTGPSHWHPDFEIATAVRERLDYQVGQQHVTLEAGDSLFVNGNMLHRLRQISGTDPDPVPIILFSGSAVAPEQSTIYQNYIQPIVRCETLPFILFRHGEAAHREVLALIRDTCRLLRRPSPCWEMAVQRNLSCLLEYIFRHLDSFPHAQATGIQLKNQIRLQQMLTYIYDHYTQTVTLEQIARAANISRSEAGRCFQTYLGCSPVEALIQYRLQTARRLLGEKTHTVQQVSQACGFHSVSYFIRKFRQTYGYTPGQSTDLGK